MKYVIDKAHSEVTFKVRHLMISNVSGQFSNFDSTFESESEDLTDAKIHFEADVDSISTGNEQRDGHLKSADFFDADNHPKLIFEAQGMKSTGGSNYKLDGQMSIRGKQLPLSLDAEFTGKMTDPYGNEKLGFEISGKLNRKEFGLHWDAVTEAGGVVVSDEVRLFVNVQFQKA